MIPQESGIPCEKLIQPEIMTPPIIWLASDASNGVSGMRFIGALWDETLPLEQRIQASSAPCAWTQLPSKAIYPDQDRFACLRAMIAIKDAKKRRIAPTKYGASRPNTPNAAPAEIGPNIRHKDWVDCEAPIAAP